MQGLIAGRIAHYVVGEIAQYYNIQEGEEYPMIITRVKDKQKGIVNGQVFLDDAVYFAQDVEFKEPSVFGGKYKNTWHLVERE
jgi:hypothetical protein